MRPSIFSLPHAFTLTDAGEVKVLESGDRLRIDQEELETVIPAIGGTVLILNGQGKGATAELLELDVDKYSAKLKVLQGSSRGSVLSNVQYEDISKVDVDYWQETRRAGGR